jgi:methanogenic corrinoid protein MtbC1
MASAEQANIAQTDLGGIDGRERPEPSGSVANLARSALQRLARSRENHKTNFGTVSEPEIRAFVALLLSSDITGAVRIVRRLEALGSSHALISDGLLSAAARALGKMWEDDELSFLDVSLGISTLFRVNALIRSGSHPLSTTGGQCALFVTLPGQAHTLGIILAAEAFRRDGWEVDLRLEASAEEVLDAAVRQDVFLVGFTAGRDASLWEIADLTTQLKALPSPPVILLGGVAPNGNGNAADRTGADVIAHRIDDALARASDLRDRAVSVR